MKSSVVVVVWMYFVCNAQIPGEEKEVDVGCTFRTTSDAVLSRHAVPFLSSCFKKSSLFEMGRHLNAVKCSENFFGG